MLELNRLTGTHRLTPDHGAAPVIDALEGVLAADPAVAGTFRDGDRIEFAMSARRWDRPWTLLGIRPRGGRIAGGKITVYADRPRDLVVYDLRLDVGRPLIIDYAWVALAFALAATGMLRGTFPIVLAAFCALRFVLRQGETEWAHAVIGRAAGEAAPTTERVDAGPLATVVPGNAGTQLS
jgi:fatty acid desaturase